MISTAKIKLYLPPATKLREGYVFTDVCDSVHREVSVPACTTGHMTGRVSVWGGLCLRGSLSRGLSVRGSLSGGSLSGGLCPGAVADLRGVRGMHAPWASKFFKFHAVFWENLAKSYVGAPLGSWHPLLGEMLDPPLRGGLYLGGLC